ncbi:MAG: type IV pilus twitching motility protein PilT [Candidatus Omnitrophota bacterium]
MDIKRYLKTMVERDASDIFFKVGMPVMLRQACGLVAASEERLSLRDVQGVVDEISGSRSGDTLRENLDVDFSWSVDEVGRFRASVFFQRGEPMVVLRYIRSSIPGFEQLNLPAAVLEKLCRETRGLIFITGIAGSGKSTTIASMIEYINNTSHRHILSIEDPIEYIFQDKGSIITQRELGIDVKSYPVALRQVALQSVDVIYIATIRDRETMQAAITAADMGMLVLATIHSVNAYQTIERIINLFPPHQHNEVRAQLSLLLRGVVSLRLLPAKDGKGRIPAYETMVATPTISRLIREGKTWELLRFIEQGKLFGMQSFKQSLSELIREDKVDKEQALGFADSRDELELELQGIRGTS